jgi:O-antigen/teichoic acid export membrane protein
MKLDIKNLLQDKFVLGTFFLTATNFVGAFFTYLVHPILTRHLSIAEYGDFQTLLSFSTIIGIISAVVTTTLIKEFSLLSSINPEGVSVLRRRALSRLFFVGLFILAGIVIFSQVLNNLFKISEPAVLIISSLGLLYIFPMMVNRATLTGKQAFSALALNNLLDTSGRLLLVILLVIVFPWGLVGASYSFAFAGLIAFVVGFWQVKKLKLAQSITESKPLLRTMWRYALIVLWFTALYQFFYNFDMLVVKYFLVQMKLVYMARFLLSVG